MLRRLSIAALLVAIPAAARKFKRLGGSGVPLILVGGKAMSGFNPESFEALLATR